MTANDLKRTFGVCSNNRMSICGGGVQLDSAKLSDWLQVVGLFAVVASLIVVGLQMKQTDAIALSAIYQERAIA